MDIDHQKKLRACSVVSVKTGFYGWLGMFEVALGAVLSILCIANLALWLKLTSCYDALTQIIKQSDDFKSKIPNIDELNDEISATLQDFVSNLHIPTAADHLMGGVSNLLQMWGMKRFGNMQQMIPGHEEQPQQYEHEAY